MLKLQTLIDAAAVVPVVVIERAADAVPMARALLAGGIGAIEVTLRSDAALAATEAIARDVPQMCVGVGSIRRTQDAADAARAGAQFAVSPGYSEAVGQACRDLGLRLVPGVATASEIMQAWGDGHELLKFFPAEASGGVAWLKAQGGPFPQLRFCPTGGITAASAPAYLALPNVPVCGGSWLTPAQAVAAGDWDTVTRLAREAAALRGGSSA